MCSQLIPQPITPLVGDSSIVCFMVQLCLKVAKAWMAMFHLSMLVYYIPVDIHVGGWQSYSELHVIIKQSYCELRGGVFFSGIWIEWSGFLVWVVFLGKIVSHCFSPLRCTIKWILPTLMHGVTWQWTIIPSMVIRNTLIHLMLQKLEISIILTLINN